MLLYWAPPAEKKLFLILGVLARAEKSFFDIAKSCKKRRRGRKSVQTMSIWLVFLIANGRFVQLFDRELMFRLGETSKLHKSSTKVLPPFV